MPIDINAQVKSSVTSLEREFAAITHNLANVNTVGYKRIVTSFSQKLEEQQKGVLDSSEADMSQSLDFSQGLSFITTSRSLDVALEDKGFFVIETENGPLYTRNGNFRVNQNGQIVDWAGRIVSGDGGPITITGDTPVSQINVSSDGTVSANGQQFGRFKIADFGEDEKKILPAGEGCFTAPENVKAVAAENVSIRQGYLESSNVKMVDEIVSMIMVSRLYEANMRFITSNKDVSNSLISVAMG